MSIKYLILQKSLNFHSKRLQIYKELLITKSHEIKKAHSPPNYSKSSQEHQALKLQFQDKNKAQQ